MVNNLPAMQETWAWSLGQEHPLEKEMATCSSILTWKIPWTEEPGELQSVGSQRVRTTEPLTLSLSYRSHILFKHLWWKETRFWFKQVSISSFSRSPKIIENTFYKRIRPKKKKNHWKVKRRTIRSKPEDLESFRLIESRRCSIDGKSTAVEKHKNVMARNLRIFIGRKELPLWLSW